MEATNVSYNYVTVSGTFATLTGTVTFTPPDDVTDLTGAVPVLGPAPAVCTVSGGSFTSAALLATDNVGLLPAGWSYLATVALTGQKAYSYPVLVPASAGTTATLSSLAVSASGGGSGEGLVNPMTTIGDVIVGGASGAAQRLAVGGSATVLTSNGSGATPTWRASTALANPMTALGDMIYGGTSPSAGSPARLTGGTTAAKNFLTQTGTGSASAAPAWGTIASADMPAGTTSAQGALQLNSTAGTVAAIAQQSAGVSALAAPADHVHPIAMPAPWGSGYAAWTGDYAATATQINPTTASYPSGALSITRMDCPPGIRVGGTLGFTWLTSGSLASTYLACFNSSGAQLGTTSTDLSALTTAYHTTSMGSFTIPSDGIVYVTYLNGTGGVAGGVRYFANLFSLSNTFNLAAPYRCSHLTGTLTTMPSSLTGGNALSSFVAWYTYGWYALY